MLLYGYFMLISVKFTPSYPGSLKLSGGPYGNSVFQLAQFHFHWSCKKNKTGSEHTINGER